MLRPTHARSYAGPGHASPVGGRGPCPPGNDDDAPLGLSDSERIAGAHGPELSVVEFTVPVGVWTSKVMRLPTPGLDGLSGMRGFGGT